MRRRFQLTRPPPEPPTSFDEAVLRLFEMVNDEDKEAVKNAESVRRAKTMAHHGLGRWIRNNWGLWAGGDLKEDLEALDFTHPDDMSSAILQRFCCEVRGETYDLNADVEHYKKHWAEYYTTKKVLHHDDSPCEERLENGYCPSCKITPDMQSTCLFTYCEKCNVRLQRLPGTRQPRPWGCLTCMVNFGLNP